MKPHDAEGGHGEITRVCQGTVSFLKRVVKLKYIGVIVTERNVEPGKILINEISEVLNRHE